MEKRYLRFARYSTLFFSLLALVMLAGMELDRPLVTLLIYAVVGSAGVFVAGDNRLYAAIAVVLAISWNAMAWIDRVFLLNADLLYGKSIFGMAFLTFLTFLVLRHLFMAREVSADLLFGAGAAYMMLGMFFAFIYQVAMLVNPECIRVGQGELTFSSLIYYSFTTLTTLGYGDIVPNSPGVRITAILEAALGVFFSAILIGRLMGLYLVGISRTER